MDNATTTTSTTQTIHDRKVTFDAPPTICLNTALTRPLGHMGPPRAQLRKLSFPAALHANLLGIAPYAKPNEENLHAKRRFSNVSDAVSRKLSTIGWRMPSVPPEEVIAQGRVLCGQYIRNRLKRSGIFSKKLGLYRLRSMVGTSSALIVRDVFPGLIAAGTELERQYPKVYNNVARQASHTPGGVLISEKAAAALLASIGHDLFKTEITWGKVVSIFAVAGALGVDCVCQGHPEYLHGLMEGMVEVLEDDLGDWIATNGGWSGFAQHCKSEDDEVTVIEYVSILIIGISVLLICYFIIRLFIKLGMF
ncbi:bcl-2-related ovarian killer protein homolog A-like isoform X2 [Atheta coriaria]